MAGVGELKKMGSSMKNMVEETANSVVGTATSIDKVVQHKTPFWVPRKFITHDPVDGTEQVHEVGFFARVFITFEHPGLSTFGQIYSTLMMVLILISCTCYVLATMPELNYIPSEDKCDGEWCEDVWKRCSDEESALFDEKFRSCGTIFVDDDQYLTDGSVSSEEQCVCIPVPFAWLDLVEFVSVLAFSFDYLLTFLTVWAVSSKMAGVEKVPETDDEDTKKRDDDEQEPPPHHDLFHTDIPEIGACARTYRYARQTMNMIDLVAIVPFYVGILSQGAEVPGAAVVRVLRLARIFRVFRIGKFNEGLGLFTRTMSASSPALTLLGFFYALGCVLFGSVIFFAEKGEFTVNKNYPQGAWLRYDEYRQPPEDGAERDEHGRYVDFYVESPFRSIPYAFYWTIVTGTTVGYGDMYPLTGLGKFLSVVTMTGGILVLALPITVIGSNFSREYAKVTGEVDEWEELLNGMDDLSDDEEEEVNAGADRKVLAIQNGESNPDDEAPARMNSAKSPKKGAKKSAGKKPNLKDIINLTIKQQAKVVPVEERTSVQRTTMKLNVMKSFSSFPASTLGNGGQQAAGLLPLTGKKDFMSQLKKSSSSFGADANDISGRTSDSTVGRMISAGANMDSGADGPSEAIGPVTVPPAMIKNMASEIGMLKNLLIHLGSTVESLESQLVTMTNQNLATSVASEVKQESSVPAPPITPAKEGSSMEVEDYKEDEDGSPNMGGISAGSGKLAPVNTLHKQGSVRALPSSAGVTSGAGTGAFDLKVNFDGFTGVLSQHEVAHAEKPKPEPASTYTPVEGVPLQTAEDPDEMVFTRIEVYEDAPATRLMNRAMSVSAFTRREREAEASGTTNQDEERSRTSGASTDSEAIERARRDSTDTAKTKAVSETSSSDSDSISRGSSFTSSEGTPSPRSAVTPGEAEANAEGNAADAAAGDEEAKGDNGDKSDGCDEKSDMVMALSLRSPSKAAVDAANANVTAGTTAGSSVAVKRSRLDRMRSFKEIGKSVRWGQSLRQKWIESRNFENLGASSREVRVKVHSLAGMPHTDIGLRGHAPLSELQVTISAGTQRHTTSTKHIRSNLTWDDENFDLRIPVSTHTGTLMLKYVEAEVHCGDTFLGMCSVPLSEVDGSTHEYRLMTRNDAKGGRRPALAGKGRILLSFEWQAVELGPDSGREHHYGTSLGRVLAVGPAYTEKLTDESWRQPPSYPQLAARRAYGPRKNSLQNRSLSPGTSSFRGGDSGGSAGNNGQHHMQGSSRPIYPASRHLAGHAQGQGAAQLQGQRDAAGVLPQTSPSGSPSASPSGSPGSSRETSPRDENLHAERAAGAEDAGAEEASAKSVNSGRQHNVPVLEFSHTGGSHTSRKAARENLRKFTGGGSAANVFEAAIRRKKLQHAALRLANSGSGQLRMNAHGL
mmetsp:Transcript_27544/g.74959  ORF Transcript_27544/g.74959 Transcript_27544/m.74959 type:complete len:1411 (-) Transcript_27544:248-4480(-)